MVLVLGMSPPHTPDLSLDLLAALDVLLAEKSVTRAAERLAITQSAMSHKLKQLREALGDPLLVQRRGGLAPTERALAIATPLRRALRDVRAAVEAGAPFEPETSQQHFVLATIDYVEYAMLGPLLTMIQERAPRITISLTTPGPDLLGRLEDGSVDLAIGGPSVAAGGAVLRKRLSMEGFVVAGRRGHPKLAAPLTPESYASLDHLLITPRGMPGSPVDEALQRLGLRRRIALRTPHFVTAPFLVARSDLVVTAPMGLIAEAEQHVPLTVVAPPVSLPEVEGSMVWHERRHPDPAHRWLRSCFEQNSLQLVARFKEILQRWALSSPGASP